MPTTCLLLFWFRCDDPWDASASLPHLIPNSRVLLMMPGSPLCGLGGNELEKAIERDGVEVSGEMDSREELSRRGDLRW